MIKLRELLSIESPINSKLRIHLSKEPISSLHDKTPIRGSEPFGKPNGLWYGFGRSWIDLVYGEGWTSRFGDYIYYVKLIKPERILKLSSVEEVEKFTETFGKESSIDWQSVSEKWGGVEFNPYLGKMHRRAANLSWYSYLDIASGCVWDVSTIQLKQIFPKNDQA